MNNWKIPIALSLFIISGIEFLAIRDHHHLTMNVFTFGMKALFVITLLAGAYLLLSGILTKRTDQ